MLMNNRIFARGLPFSLCTFLAACFGNSSVNTLDDLVISASNDGAYRKPINYNYPLQTRFLAINGQLPISSPGDKCIASGFRPGSSFVCLGDDPETKILVRRYPFAATPSENPVAALRAVRDSLEDLQIKILDIISLEAAAQKDGKGQTVVDDQLKDAASKVTTKAQAVAENIQRNNFFIFRSNENSNAGGDATLGDTASVKAGRQSGQKKLVIVGGLTVSQLLIGKNDLGANNAGFLSGYPKSTKIATYTMGAEHLIYFSGVDLSAAISASLKGDLASWKKISPQTKAAINAYAAIGQAFETQGSFTATGTEIIDLQQYRSKYGAQQVFFSTMTDIKTLRDTLKE